MRFGDVNCRFIGRDLIRCAAAGIVTAMFASCAMVGSNTSHEPEVRRAVSCFAASWSRNDAAGLGRCFTSDADFVSAGGFWWQGRDAIQKNLAFLLGRGDIAERAVTVPVQSYGVFEHTVFAFTTMHVRALRANVSVVHASWRLSNEHTRKPRLGLMTLVIVNEAGVWRIAAVHDSETDAATGIGR